MTATADDRSAVRAPRRGKLAATVTLAVVVLCLTGCGSKVLTLSADESDLPLCAIGHEPIPVESLNTDKKRPCKPVDGDLVFPDGTHITLGPNDGAGSTTGGGRYDQFIDVGNYGIVASSAGGNCTKAQEWGSTIALAKVRKAFGKDWACPSSK